jgi:hypothetical protein
VGDLAGDELEAAAGALVVEEDPRAGVEAVTLAVIDGDEVGVDLGHPVGAARVEGRQLVLRGFPDFAEHLAGGGLVEAGVGLRFSHRLQHPGDAEAGELRRQRRLVPGGADERHRREVVDLVRFALPDHVAERALVQEVAGVNRDPVAEAFEPVVVLAGEAPDKAVDLVALFEQEFSQIAAVLAGDSGNQRPPPHWRKDYLLTLQFR